MKSYPSIPRSTGTAFSEFNAYVFDKLDGSNLRFEWSKKQKWYKFGTRTRLFDKSDEVFGEAIPLFQSTMADKIEKIAVDNRWESVIVFAEFYGAKSFAGLHEPGDKKFLSVFDVAPYKKGILGPKEFLDLFCGKVNTATFLGQYHWTRGFVEKVRMGAIEDITLEGVVGKAGSGHKLQMSKAKTQRWIDMVLAIKSPEEAKKIIES